MTTATAIPVTLDQQVQAVAREIAMRRSAYPKWIAAKKMTQAKADQEIAAMEAVLETLKAARLDPTGAAALIAQYRAALQQCVNVAQHWHGDYAFDLYFNHSPEMKPVRDVLGPMPETV